MQLLQLLATSAEVARKRDAMFAGAAINATENRAVLHVALRNRSNRPVLVDGKDVMPAVNDALKRMAAFATGLRAGTITAAGGAKFTDVVNIGIGGSDLGPAMATLALAPYHDGPRLHFVSNVDGAHIADTLARLDPATTLFIVASKTFTTIETMTNAQTARRWIVEHLGEAAVGRAFRRHLDRARQGRRLRHRRGPHLRFLGLGRRPLFDLVGDRPAADDRHRRPSDFGEFLDGAHAMDEHFRTAPFDRNLPVLLGLLGVWHRNVCGYGSRAVIPYDQRLQRLPAYLQQLDMESNGKRVTRDGRAGGGDRPAPSSGANRAPTASMPSSSSCIRAPMSIPVEFLIAARVRTSPIWRSSRSAGGQLPGADRRR